MINELKQYRNQLSKTDHANNYKVMDSMVEQFQNDDTFHRNYGEMNIINGADFKANVHGVLGTDTQFSVDPSEWYYIDDYEYVKQLNYDVICDLIDDTIFELEN